MTELGRRGWMMSNISTPDHLRAMYSYSDSSMAPRILTDSNLAYAVSMLESDLCCLLVNLCSMHAGKGRRPGQRQPQPQ